jgi:DNA-binding MarR family transcriptional regulator
MHMKTIALFRHSMRRIERAVMLQNKNEATCCGVTLAQCHAVLEIGSADGMSVKELSARLGLDKSTLSRTVESLVEDGLVERTTSPEDRRAIVIRLTAKGRASADRINATWNRICADIFKDIPEKKHGSIIEAMNLIAGALTRTTCGFQPGKKCRS